MQKYFSCVNLLSATFSKILVMLVLQVQLCLWFCTPTYTEAAKEQLPAAENGTLKFPGLFAFGDSILDTGNNNNLATVAKCNFPPYGRDLVGGIPTGRFGNGKVLSDLIAEGLGIKELLPPYLDPNLQSPDLPTGVCFASGSSGYDPLTPTITGTLSVFKQLELFKEYIVKLTGIIGEERARAIIANSLYLVSAGNNDILISYSLIARKLHYDFPSYAALLVSMASTFLKDLYSLGARRIGVFSTAAVGCSPFDRNRGGLLRECLELELEEAAWFNSQLSSELDYIKTNFTDAKLVFLDIYHPLLDLNQHPHKSGFQVEKFGCCGTGTIGVAVLCNEFSPFTCTDASKYLYWDAVHPTERALRIVASQILEKYINSFF
ncbi:GDSL esterase/lipase At3g14820-like [Prunus dulcis]|nr:GDSL esterase/lipase At3g14820-like [Prunus dulcis]